MRRFDAQEVGKMKDHQKRIIGRSTAAELTEAELTRVAGGSDWQDVKFTLYDTNGGADDTQLTDK